VVPETVSHFIGGQHVHSTLRKSYGVTDPATGKEYAQVEVGLAADVNQAVLAARTALETGQWPGMAAADRARVLCGIADAIDARAGDIAAAEALGTGLPVTQASCWRRSPPRRACPTACSTSCTAPSIAKPPAPRRGTP
jgi:5-carboxymethyl-2-hydroxymuconic-semialdehyde dehydrogenase